MTIMYVFHRMFFFIILIFSLNVHLEASGFASKERFILHFDVNETLIASDQATGKSTKDNVNRALANKYREKWSESIAEPISYKDYVYQYLFPSNGHDPKLKRKRLDKLFNFVDFIKSSEYPIKNQVLAEYQYSMSKFDVDGLQIFPSFFHMVRELKRQNVNFTIQIRTFGKDLEDVIQAISSQLGCQLFTKRGRFENKELILENNQKMTSLKSIYDTFKCYNVGVQDNWNEWSEHQSLGEYGKLFPVDLQDPCTISIFFDDNIRGQTVSKKNIVAPVDVQTGQRLSTADLIETRNLVPVDMLQAIQDDHYFIKKINEARSHSLKQKRIELLKLVEQFD